jgi:hypothetical protein
MSRTGRPNLTLRHRRLRMTGTEPHAPRGTAGRGPNRDGGPCAGHAGECTALYEAAPLPWAQPGTGRARAADATRRRMHILAPLAAKRTHAPTHAYVGTAGRGTRKRTVGSELAGRAV